MALRDLRSAFGAYRTLIRARRLVASGGWSALAGSLPANPSGPIGATDPDRVARITETVARAARRLPLDTRCLERSYATCVALRKAGIAATIQIGVRRRPPLLFHAWTQVGSDVVNESRPVQEEYHVVHQI